MKVARVNTLKFVCTIAVNMMFFFGFVGRKIRFREGRILRAAVPVTSLDIVPNIKLILKRI